MLANIDLRCDAGYCADDEGEGGIFQLCGKSTNKCAKRFDNMICAVAQDGNSRCLSERNIPNRTLRTGCAYSDEKIKVKELAMNTITDGFS